MLGAKPLAALSSGLLARKGQARPAMRRPVLGQDLGALPEAEDDLGWNDMGEAPLPPVLAERRALEQEVAAVLPLTEEAPGARTGGRKAAFTLRLDAERHLMLRLAAAARGRSAQLIVTEALDRLLAGMPDVAVLRGQLPADHRLPATNARNARGK